MHQLMNLRNRDSKSLYYLWVGMGGGALKGSLGRYVLPRPSNLDPVKDRNCSFRYPV